LEAIIFDPIGSKTGDLPEKAAKVTSWGQIFSLKAP